MLILTLSVPMESPIKFDTVESAWSIVYIEGSQVIIPQKIFISLKIELFLAKSVDLGEMLHYALFHLCFHCLPKYLF